MVRLARNGVLGSSLPISTEKAAVAAQSLTQDTWMYHANAEKCQDRGGVNLRIPILLKPFDFDPRGSIGFAE